MCYLFTCIIMVLHMMVCSYVESDSLAALVAGAIVAVIIVIIIIIIIIIITASIPFILR